MRWFKKDNKTDKISAVETAIVRLTAEVSQLKQVAQSTHRQVGEIKETLEADHLAHATCANTQEHRWDAHEREHERYDAAFEELRELVKANSENIRILSATVSRLADRQRQQGG